MKRLALLLVVLALVPPAVAQNVNEQLSDLKKAGEEFAAAASIGAGNASLQGVAAEYREFSNNYSSLESYISNGNHEEAIRTLRRWISRTKNEQLKKSLQVLQASLEKDQEARLAKVNTDLAALIKATNESLATTNSVEDVAGLREKLEAFRDTELSQGGRSLRSQQDRINRAVNLLESWQRILIAENSGEPAEALRYLRDLRNNSYSAGLLDEKTIAAKTNALLSQVLAQADKGGESPLRKAVLSAIEKIKTPADAQRALIILRKLQQATVYEDAQLTSQAQNSITQYLRMNRDFEAGAYARVIGHVSSDYEFEFGDRIEALKNDLRAKSAALSNDLADLGEPKAGESFGAFIRRKAEDAYKAKNWPDLFALLSVYTSATGGGCSRTQGMQEGVRAYIAGQQLEKAGQFKDAATSYSLCIAQVGPLVPREEAAAALERLKGSGKLDEVR